MKNKTKTIYFLIILFFVVLSPQFVLAEYELLEEVPWNTSGGFPAYVTGLYNFALGFVILAALMMITIGGFYYITSAGNQAQAGTAKKIITDALLGLVVVFITYLVLYTINPDLLKTGPNLGKLQDPIDSFQQESAKPWQAVQKDTWCSKNLTPPACQDSKETCELFHGAGACDKSSNVVKNQKAYSLENGRITEYENYQACVAAGNSNCVNGGKLAGDLRFGISEADRRNTLAQNNIRADWKANTSNLTDNDISTLGAVSQALGKNDVNQLYINGVESGENKVVHANLGSDISKIKKMDGVHEMGTDANGNVLYQVTDQNNPLYGTVFVDTGGDDDRIMLPKNGGGIYTTDEMGIISATDDGSGLGTQDSSADTSSEIPISS